MPTEAGSSRNLGLASRAIATIRDAACSALAGVAAMAAWFVVTLPAFIAVPRQVDWAFHAIIPVAGAVGLAYGRWFRHSMGLLPTALGWAIPFAILHLLVGCSPPQDSVWPDHIEWAVKTSWLLFPPMAGIAGTRLGARSRRSSVRTWMAIFWFALIALAVAYRIAFGVLNSAYGLHR